jgi:hypothetical protein
MENDDLLPNDSTFLGGVPAEPKEQIIARKKEKARTLEAKKELEVILSHFQDHIDATDSIQKALELAHEYRISQENALITLNIVRQQLQQEYNYISDLLEVHA